MKTLAIIITFALSGCQMLTPDAQRTVTKLEKNLGKVVDAWGDNLTAKALPLPKKKGLAK